MASRREEQRETERLRVMRLLSDNPELSTRELADNVGISNGSAYYVLKALVEKGFVKLENLGNSRSKRLYIYLLTPEGVREKSKLTHRFIVRKREEYLSLKAEIKALEKEFKLNGKSTNL